METYVTVTDPLFFLFCHNNATWITGSSYNPRHDSDLLNLNEWYVFKTVFGVGDDSAWLTVNPCTRTGRISQWLEDISIVVDHQPCNTPRLPIATFSITTETKVTMTTPVSTDPLVIHDSTTARVTTATITTNASSDTPRWTRLNYKGIYHDNRRLLKHRAKNCECFVCYREIHKLPPMETHQEYVASVKSKVEERQIKKAIRKAKKEVKAGKQRSIKMFFSGSEP